MSGDGDIKNFISAVGLFYFGRQLAPQLEAAALTRLTRIYTSAALNCLSEDLKIKFESEENLKKILVERTLRNTAVIDVSMNVYGFNHFQ